jgi:tRNA(Arg) A34 adenosine deaminase TadA
MDTVSPFLQMAIDEAEKAGARGEVPVGAVLVDEKGVVVAVSGNRVEERKDPTAHAEILVLQAGSSEKGAARLDTCDLYVSLEPCAMCAAAISFARIRRLYFAAYDMKGGAVDHGPRFFSQPTCHHAPEVYGGLGGEKARTLLQDFFKERRK